MRAVTGDVGGIKGLSSRLLHHVTSIDYVSHEWIVVHRMYLLMTVHLHRENLVFHAMTNRATYHTAMKIAVVCAVEALLIDSMQINSLWGTVVHHTSMHWTMHHPS